MIAERKYCEIILNNPQLLGELVKKIGSTMKLQSLELSLKRGNASIRKSNAFIETLKAAGYSDDEIFEKETVK